MFGGSVGAFVRTVYLLGSSMIDGYSDDLEQKAATEAAEIALNSDANWDNEAMRRVAEFLVGFGNRLLDKLNNNDPNFGNDS